MKIKKMLSQRRRGFTAIFACEHCGGAQIGCGYADADFHNNAIPNMKCGSCGKSSCKERQTICTQYSDGVQV